MLANLASRVFGVGLDYELTEVVDDLAAQVGDEQVELTWTNPSYTHTTQPQYKAHASDTWLNFGSPLAAPISTATVTGLTNGTNYDFRLAAVGQDTSYSAISNIANATPADESTPFSAGMIEVTSVGDETVTIGQSGTPGGGTAPYTVELYRGTAADLDPPGEGTLIATELPYQDTGRTNGVEYFYVARYQDDDAGDENSNEVSGTPAAASSLHPNEPEGYVAVAESDFNAMPPSDWAYFDQLSGAQQGMSITTDATAPKSPPNVAQAFFPTGFVGGGAPGGLFSPSYSTRYLYFQFIFKISDDWYGHSSGIGKIFYLSTGPGGANDDFYLVAYGAGDAALDLRIFTQNTHDGGNYYPRNLGVSGDTALVRGEWRTIELVIAYDSTPTAHDGVLKVWVDGVQTHDYTNASLLRVGATVGTQLHWGPIYGGGGEDSVPADQYQYLDYIYISAA